MGDGTPGRSPAPSGGTDRTLSVDPHVVGAGRPRSGQSIDPIADGPLQHGFDTFFGISASLDMPPFAFIENDRFTQELTVQKKWVRAGPAAKDFEAVDVVPTLVRKASEFVAGHAADARARAFDICK